MKIKISYRDGYSSSDREEECSDIIIENGFLHLMQKADPPFANVDILYKLINATDIDTVEVLEKNLD